MSSIVVKILCFIGIHNYKQNVFGRMIDGICSRCGMVSQELITRKLPMIDKTVKIRGNVIIDDGAFIARGCDLAGDVHIEKAILGPYVMCISEDHVRDETGAVTIRGGVNKPILIKKGSWIGAGSIILKGVTVGANAIVGAGSVVTRDVPDGVTVKGVPAR